VRGSVPRLVSALFIPLVAVAIAGAIGPPAAAGDAGRQLVVDLVKVNGVIDGPMRDYLLGTVEEAERDGSVVVIQLDSPGTMGIDARALGLRISEAGVPVVAWIGPSGSGAAGGALLLTLAAHLSAMSPGAGVGPIQPIDLADEDSRPPGELPWADPEDLPGQAIPAQQALETGVVDVSGPELGSLNDVLKAVDGRTVVFGRGSAALDTWDEARDIPPMVRFHDLGPARRVLHAVASPVAIYVLLSLGLALMAFELTQAGIGVAGFSGGAMVALAVYGLVVVPPSWAGLAPLIGGIVAMAVDVRFRRLSVLSLLGIVAFTLGSVIVYGDVAEAIDLPVWLIVGAVAATVLYYGFGLTVAIQSRERLTSTRRGLIGLPGETRGPLAPDGPVFVKGALWRGRAMDGPIPPGTRIRVRGVDGLILRVEPED
jgi:membrane-bound serine protease (ClpP class)